MKKHKIIIDFADEKDVYLRIKTEDIYLSEIRKIVRRVKRKEDYNSLDLIEALRKAKIPFRNIPLDPNVLIYF